MKISDETRQALYAAIDESATQVRIELKLPCEADWRLSKVAEDAHCRVKKALNIEDRPSAEVRR